MKKHQILMMVVGSVLAFGILAGCGNSSTKQDSEEAEVEVLNLVTTTSQVLGGPTQMLQEKLTKASEEKEGFTFTHYDSSTLFKSAEEFQALVDHDVDIAFLSTSWFYDNGAKWCDMYASTYLFDSYDQVKAYFDPESETGAQFQKKCLRLEGSNFRLGGIALIARAVPSFLALNERIFLMRLAVSVAWQKGN